MDLDKKPNKGRGRGVGSGRLSSGTNLGAPQSNQQLEEKIKSTHERFTQSKAQNNNPRSPMTASSHHQDQPNQPRTAQSDSSVFASSNGGLNVAASVFIPRGTKSDTGIPDSEQPIVQLMNSACIQETGDNMELITYLETILDVLLNNPSQFDRLAPELTHYLANNIKSEQELFYCADVMFEWAIMQDNFSYTLARVCHYVSSHAININYNGTLVQHLLKRCHLEHQEREKMVCEKPIRLRQFSILIAELYTGSQTIKALMNAILELIETMLNHINDMYAKTITQLLKMTGGVLEEGLLTHNRSSDRLTEIISSIRNACASTTSLLSRSSKNMLMSAVTLSQANWGRSTSPIISTPSTPTLPSELSLEPVFYSLTGQMISRREAGFDESEEEPAISEASSLSLPEARGDNSQTISYDEDDADEQDIIVVDDDEEMTDDMWAAFAKFERERDQLLQES